MLATLQSLVAYEHTNSSGWARTNCPFCIERKGTNDTRRSLGFNEFMGIAKCFRCDFRFSLGGYKRTSPVKSEKRDFVLNDRLYPVLCDDNCVATAVRDYLYSRGMSDVEIAAADVHYCTGGREIGRAVFPHKDEEGKWWGYSARAVPSMRPSGPKVMGPSTDKTRFYNEQALKEDTQSPLLVVEGAIDACRYLPDVVATLGKPGALFLEKVVDIHKTNGKIRPVIFCLDGDAYRESRFLHKKLERRGIPSGHVILPAGTDPDEVDSNWLKKQVEEVAENL